MYKDSKKVTSLYNSIFLIYKDLFLIVHFSTYCILIINMKEVIPSHKYNHSTTDVKKSNKHLLIFQ